MFPKLIVLIIDLAALCHAVDDNTLLLDYYKYEQSQEIEVAKKKMKVALLKKGCLPVRIILEKSRCIMILSNVQYAPDISDYIISAAALNRQFKTTLVLNPASGYLMYRKHRGKIAAIEQSKDIYKMRGFIMNSDDIKLLHDSDTVSLEATKITNNFYSFGELSSRTLDTISQSQLLENNVCFEVMTRNTRRKTKRNLSEKDIAMLQKEGELWYCRLGHISSSVLHRLPHVSHGTGSFLKSFWLGILSLATINSIVLDCSVIILHF
jgi:hypothetical protein